MKAITFFKEDREPTPDKPNEIITGIVDENAEIYIKRLQQENKELNKKYENAVSDYEQEHYKVIKANKYIKNYYFVDGIRIMDIDDKNALLEILGE